MQKNAVKTKSSNSNKSIKNELDDKLLKVIETITNEHNKGKER